MVDGRKGIKTPVCSQKETSSLQNRSANASVSSDEREGAPLLHILKCHFPKRLL